jgi:hypothetical protein
MSSDYDVIVIGGRSIQETRVCATDLDTRETVLWNT